MTTRNRPEPIKFQAAGVSLGSASSLRAAARVYARHGHQGRWARGM